MISIAMTTFNGERYLKEQLLSIQEQTIQDFEVVICDDCSTDATIEIIHEFAARDNRIKFYQNSINLGFKNNFAKAISLCSGDYIALADQDDIWLPLHLEILVRNIGKASLACANSELIDSKGGSLGKTLKWQEALDRVPSSDIGKAMTVMYYRNPFQGSSMLLKKSFAKKAIPFPEGLPYHDTWLSCLACMDDGMVYIDEIIGLYRMHNSNASGLHVVRKNKFLHWFMRGFHGLWADRKVIISEIKNRIDLKGEKKKFINDSEKRFENVYSRSARLKNWLFLTCHFRTIYSC